MADELYRINIQIPNPELGRWLKGPECRAAVEKVVDEIFLLYVGALPEITGNLKRGADKYMVIDGWNGEPDRWFGYITNTALSYRRQRGKPYPRYIEYGKPTKGVAGQGQLRHAAAIVTGQGSAPLAGFSSRDARGRFRNQHGRFVRNPLQPPRRRRRPTT